MLSKQVKKRIYRNKLRRQTNLFKSRVNRALVEARKPISFAHLPQPDLEPEQTTPPTGLPLREYQKELTGGIPKGQMFVLGGGKEEPTGVNDEHPATRP